MESISARQMALIVESSAASSAKVSGGSCIPPNLTQRPFHRTSNQIVWGHRCVVQCLEAAAVLMGLQCRIQQYQALL